MQEVAILQNVQNLLGHVQQLIPLIEIGQSSANPNKRPYQVIEVGESSRRENNKINPPFPLPTQEEHFHNEDECSSDNIEAGLDHLIQVHEELKHIIGTLLPKQGHHPIYAQLYIYDSSSALNARSKHNPQQDPDIFQVILDDLLESNSFVRIYQQAHEVLKVSSSTNGQNVNVRAHLYYSSRIDRHRYNLPSTDEIAVVLPGDAHEPCSTIDIIIHLRSEQELMRISECHLAYLPMHYVLLFP
ncbi:hypothetical protein GIB67_016169 [Kingdonia uniflora]|uniref:Uncharacterized protein n=1 Tax=Kingdonia uniflora TaxID=39325 RepID=A0A7J7N9A7_9MAGN|nr:hypothetical protein GIB67_016169 [Kingdonia uniflora]